jgi:selenocysteine lyase/cysteine desulfurase
MLFAQENAFTGAEHYPEWLEKEHELRGQLKTLINAPSCADIALLKNTSEALSVVAYGLTWQTGDNVVISDQEFPSNRVVWESLQSQGVEIRQVALNSKERDLTPEQSLIQAIDERTRLLSISSIQYATGLAVDLYQLGAYCQQHNVLFCVDAIQSVGALPIDVQAIHADFLMADGHKWMLGPEGLALFYCKRERLDSLKLHQYGWHMLEHAGDYDQKQWSVAKTARRFECGSPNMLSIHALSASLGLLLETGMDKVGQQVCQNSRYLMDALANIKGVSLITPKEQGRFGGIVTFSATGKDHQQLFNQYKEQRIVCAMRGGGIRFSPHFYTGKAVLDRALEIVEKSIG